MAVIPSPGLILPVSDRVVLVQGTPPLSPPGIARIAMIAGVPSVSINGGAYASFGTGGAAPSGTKESATILPVSDRLDIIQGTPPKSPIGCASLAIIGGVASLSVEGAAFASLGASGSASAGSALFPGFLPPTGWVDIIQGSPPVSRPGTARIACFPGATTLSISIEGGAYVTLGNSPPGTPTLWFDAQNIDGLGNSSLVDGQQIGTWTNLSSLGAAANAVQATGGLRPTFKLLGSSGKINNKSSVLFTPTQWMQTPNVANQAQPNVICAVMKPIAGNGTIADGNDGVNRNDLLFSGGTFQLFAGTSLYNSAIAATAGSYHVLRALFNAASSTIRVNKATSTAGTSPGTAILDGLSIGVAGDATTPINGEIVELLVYGAGTAPADALLDAYFDTKYGSSWPQ